MAFTNITKNINGTWEIYSALDMTKFQAEMAAFAGNTSIGMSKQDLSKTELKITVNVYNADGDEKGTLAVVHTIPAQYENAISHLEDDAHDLIVAMAGVDATAERDTDTESWSAKYSCKLVDDTFQVNFHKKEVVVQNYSNNTTKTSLETYFATRPNLAQTAPSS